VREKNKNSAEFLQKKTVSGERILSR